MLLIQNFGLNLQDVKWKFLFFFGVFVNIPKNDISGIT